MRLIITGGGTGGHLYPALAIGRAFQKRGAEVHYIGSRCGIEKDIMKNSDFPTDLLPVEAMRNKNLLTLPRGVYHLMRSRSQAKRIVKQFAPDLIIGTGGYASFPVLDAGVSLGVKTMIHEANAEMGKANERLAAKVDCLCLTYQSTARQVKNTKNVKITGMPVRESIKTSTREQGADYLGINDDTLLVTITGGSQGSHHINEAMAAYYEHYHGTDNILFYHIVGRQNTSDGTAVEHIPHVRVNTYEERMDLVLARTDICVGRAGASFLAEVAVKGLPTILVPYPFSNGHQEKNAAYFDGIGAANMVLDRDLPDGLIQALDRLIENETYRKNMGKKMLGEAKADALDKIVEAGIALLK